MALTTCEDCGGNVSTAAAACPHCGRPMTAKPEAPAPVEVQEPEPEPEPAARALQFGFGTLLVLAGIGVAIALAVPRLIEKSKSQAMPTTERAAAVDTPIEVTADRIAHAYEGNELHADDLYRGKHLLVTGVVDSVVKAAITGTPTLYLRGGAFGLVMAQFTSATGLAELRPGQPVQILCIGGGGGLGVPPLDHCTLETP